MHNLKIIKDNKFKNIHISIRFLTNLHFEDVVGKMILANIMNDVCKMYHTKKKLTDQLDALYGASYSAQSNVIGQSQVMVVKTKTIHSSYINGQVNLLEEQFKLLNQFIFHPLMENGLFLKNHFEEAKKFLKAHLLRLDDDPSAYCMFEAMKIAGENQPLANGVAMSVNDVDAVSIEEVSKLYFNMLANSQIDIIVFGDVENDEVENLAKLYLPFSNENIRKFKPSYCMNAHHMERLQYGYRDLSQSYITSIYASNIGNMEHEFASLRVANAIFGQLPSSLLFQEVREKNSLCYSIQSALYPYDGAMAISTGVAKENIEKTLSLITIQYEKMRNGNFDDSLLDVSKAMIINSLIATNDDAESMISLAYRNILFDRDESVNDIIHKIENVTKTDVIHVMNKSELITSFVLTERTNS